MLKNILIKIEKKYAKIGKIGVMQYHGYVDYPGKGKIKDLDVYNLILDHSRLIDRINPARMTEMSLLGQCILMGIFDGVDPNDLSWKFYGKDSLKISKFFK